MDETLSSQIEKLVSSLKVLEDQQAVLGDVILPAINAVRQQIAALEAQANQPVQPAEERRIVTILFTDIVGSTALAEKLDPEEWREVVLAIHSMAGKCVQKQHGAVLQYLGDGLLAVFGAQGISERDPENAVRAGLEIQAGMAALADVPPIQMRVGIHTGLVVIGELDLEARREFTASGDAMNIAARLQASAPPGGVLISQDTYSYLRGAFEVIPQPALVVKGKSEPLQTYVVIRYFPRGFDTSTRGVAGVETPTVGREVEFGRIHTAFLEALERNQFKWVQLTGEPGIGKTRLLNELLHEVDSRAEGVITLKARALQGEERQPFAWMRHLLFDYFRIAEDASLADAEAQWIDGFRSVWNQLSGTFGDFENLREQGAYALGLLVGLPFNNSLLPEGIRQDPAQVKGLAYVASRSILQAARLQAPLVIFLEDLQWIDTASWDYVSEVILKQEFDQPASRGLFGLATARLEWVAPHNLSEHPGYEQIHLDPLSASAARLLLGSLLNKAQGVPEEVLDLVVKRAEGNPYFIEEMVNWFLDRGVIDRRATPWCFSAEKAKDSLFPATLQHLLLTRLELLGELDRAVLQRGSVYGRNFWESALEEPHSGEILEKLQTRSFVIAQSVSTFHGEAEWSFYHNLQRETAYESLLIRDRKRLHQLAKAWMEKRAVEADRLEEFAGVIGEHAAKAGETSEAAGWFLRAGRYASARGAFLDARQFFERALAYTPPSELDRQWELRLEHSKVVLILGDFNARRSDDKALLSLAEASGDDNRSAQAYYNQGFSLTKTGDHRAAIQAFQTGLSLARRALNRRLEALILGQLVACYSMLSETSAAEAAGQQALECLQSVDDETVSAEVLSNLTLGYLTSGDLVRAIHLENQQMEVFHRLGDRANEAISLANVGYFYLHLGQYANAHAALETSSQLADFIGYRHTSAYNRLNLCLVYWREGKTAAAREILDQTIPALNELQDSFALAASQSYLGLVLEQSGEIKAAQDCFTQACQKFEQTGARSYAADAWAGKARCALALGELDQARQAVEIIWQVLQETGVEGLELPFLAYQTCVQVFRALNEKEAATSVLKAGYQCLMDRSKKISDPEWWRSYLENIPEHRFLVNAWG